MSLKTNPRECKILDSAALCNGYVCMHYIYINDGPYKQKI